MYVLINIWRLVHRCSRGRTSPPNSRCQFTCFTCNFTCFTGANVQMLTAERGACLCQGKCERWEQVNDMNTVALSNAKAEMLLLSKDRKAAEDKLARYAHILERPTADPHTYPPYIPLIHTPHTISSRGMRTS